MTSTLEAIAPQLDAQHTTGARFTMWSLQDRIRGWRPRIFAAGTMLTKPERARA